MERESRTWDYQTPPSEKQSIGEFEDGQDYVLPVLSNTSVGSDSDKVSAELSLWDEKYRPDIGYCINVSFEV
jgi:hypothetical protein